MQHSFFKTKWAYIRSVYFVKAIVNQTDLDKAKQASVGRNDFDKATTRSTIEQMIYYYPDIAKLAKLTFTRFSQGFKKVLTRFI